MICLSNLESKSNFYVNMTKFEDIKWVFRSHKPKKNDKCFVRLKIFCSSSDTSLPMLKRG